MRKFFSLVCTLFVALQVYSQQSGDKVRETEQALVRFYIAYMSAESPSAFQRIRSEWLTKRMQSKLLRLDITTSSDNLLRAQDTSEEGIQSLACRHIGEAWYEVSYRFSAGDSIKYIPVRVVASGDGSVKIDYVTPEWGGRSHGDEVCSVPRPEAVRAAGDVLSFVRSFYLNYCYPYASLSPTLESDLEKVRGKYCTAEMLKTFDTQLALSRKEMTYTDAVICSSDFDALWHKNLHFRQITESVVEVSFWCVRLSVKAEKEHGMWRIAAVNPEG